MKGVAGRRHSVSSTTPGEGLGAVERRPEDAFRLIDATSMSIISSSVVMYGAGLAGEKV